MKRLTSKNVGRVPKSDRWLVDLTAEALWRNLPENVRKDILKLLQRGCTPAQIEANMREVIAMKNPGLSPPKLKEKAGRFFLVSEYAKRNNLHLN